jgi:hypothetical protein
MEGICTQLKYLNAIAVPNLQLIDIQKIIQDKMCAIVTEADIGAYGFGLKAIDPERLQVLLRSIFSAEHPEQIGTY